MDAVGVETLLKGPAELSGAAESPLAIQTKAFFMLPVVAQSVLLDTDAQQNRTDAQILGLKEYHRQTEELL